MANELTIYRGETKTWTFTVTNNAVVMDITLATIKFAARKQWPTATTVADTDANIAKSTSSGIVITDGANGEFELTLLHADTNALAIGDYFYGVEMIPAGETEPLVVVQSTLTIEADIVRAI